MSAGRSKTATRDEDPQLIGVRRRLRTISLMGVLLTNAVFIAVWFLFIPELPLYIPLLFVALSVGVWWVVVKSRIEALGRKKE